ncbi:head GIN domain-containing protein [Dyadobacter sp. NIV53]|uniref:head GIN domain-containing protein n=1 Tax=Dyadobacter sp. NIV53 TaxID=2861765 RepID=UPI001C87B5EF|nr:head GIN domain-containing protein [Dyadobacter sp. NIV53]
MKKLFLIFSLFSLATIQSCIYVNDRDDIPPRGESTRTYDFRNFDELEMGHAFQVNVQEGAAYAVSATGELNDLDDLEIFVQEEKLVARYRNSWRNREPMNIDITMPTLAAVDFSGAIDSQIEGFSNLSKLEIELSGASKCDFIGSAKTIDFDLSGASQLYLSGNGQFLDGELSGASQLDALDLPVEESDLKLSGASDAKVWASKFLEVDASGASSVRYKGDPAIKQNLSGGSTLRRQ